MALSFQIIPDAHVQVDSRRYVLEIHSDAQGEVWRSSYLGRDTDDRNVIAIARATQLGKDLANIEVDNAISSDSAPTMRFQTGAEFLGRVREFYRNEQSERLVHIARWLRRRIAAGDVTENQVRNAFGFSMPQWDAFKTKMQARDDALRLIEEARGE